MISEETILAIGKKLPLQSIHTITLYAIPGKKKEHVSSVWKELHTLTKNTTITNSWDWVSTWLDMFETRVDASFLVGFHKGKLCSATLIAKETHRRFPFPVKTYHVSTNGEPYASQIRMIRNSILAEETTKKDCIAAILEAMIQTFSAEEVVFDDYDPADAKYILQVLDEKKYRYTIKREPTVWLNLQRAREEKKSVMKYFGHYMRRGIKRSMKVFPDLSVEWAESEEQAIDMLDELIVFYQRTWKSRGRHGMFSSATFTAFQKEVITISVRNNIKPLLRDTFMKFYTNLDASTHSPLLLRLLRRVFR